MRGMLSAGNIQSVLMAGKRALAKRRVVLVCFWLVENTAYFFWLSMPIGSRVGISWPVTELNKNETIVLHLIVVGRFACLNDPGSYISWDCSPWYVKPCWAGCRWKVRRIAAPNPPGWGLGEGPITLPNKTPCTTETARPNAQQSAERIGEVRWYIAINTLF